MTFPQSIRAKDLTRIFTGDTINMVDKARKVKKANKAKSPAKSKQDGGLR